MFQSAPPAIQGGNLQRRRRPRCAQTFQSAPPAIQGGNTRTRGEALALLEFQSAPPAIQGGNTRGLSGRTRISCFNPPPRPSRGETTPADPTATELTGFNPPPRPSRGETRWRWAGNDPDPVSIRPPGHPGGKRPGRGASCPGDGFNPPPRPSRGETRAPGQRLAPAYRFQSAPPAIQGGNGRWPVMTPAPRSYDQFNHLGIMVVAS